MTRLGWNDPKRTHPCDLCGGRRYVGAAGLKAHRIVAHGPTPYGCQCGQKFKFRGELEKHQASVCPLRITVAVPTQPPEEEPVEDEEEDYIPQVPSVDDVPTVTQEVVIEEEPVVPSASFDLDDSEDLGEPPIEINIPSVHFNNSHGRDFSMDGSTIAPSDTDRHAQNIDTEEAERAVAAAIKILAQSTPNKWTAPNGGTNVPIEVIREVQANFKVPVVEEIQTSIDEPTIVVSERPSLTSILMSPFGQSIEMTAFTLFLGLVLYFAFTIPVASISTSVFFFVLRGLTTIISTTIYHAALAAFSIWAAFSLVEMSAKTYHHHTNAVSAEGLLQHAQHGIADRFSAIAPSTQESVTLNISCGVCNNSPTDLTATTCGHLFCRECINRALDENPQCPSCEREIASSGGLVEICI